MPVQIIDARKIQTLSLEQRKSAVTCVYFVLVGDFIKIGASSDWRRRIGNIKTASPYEVEVLLVEYNRPDFEREMHLRFKELHHKGEWYRAADPLLSYIKKRAADPHRNLVSPL